MRVNFYVELTFLQVMKLLLLLSSVASVKSEFLGLTISWPSSLRSFAGKLLCFQLFPDKVSSATRLVFSERTIVTSAFPDIHTYIYIYYVIIRWIIFTLVIFKMWNVTHKRAEMRRPISRFTLYWVEACSDCLNQHYVSEPSLNLFFCSALGTSIYCELSCEDNWDIELSV